MPYSAQWAYLGAINRSAGALSPTEGKVIERTILIFSPISTMNECEWNPQFQGWALDIYLIQGFSCW